MVKNWDLKKLMVTGQFVINLASLKPQVANAGGIMKNSSNRIETGEATGIEYWPTVFLSVRRVD
jgi:hypothetical protein